jgi:hypothetical protein
MNYTQINIVANIDQKAVFKKPAKRNFPAITDKTELGNLL